MYQRAHENFESVDVAIAAAAVSDYRPKDVASQKIKKESESLNLELIKNKDILQSLGEMKNKQFLVGFALETENEIENAKKKLQKKNLDAIVLNSLNDEGAGFAKTTNKITFIDKNSDITAFELKTKSEVAKDIWKEIMKRRNA